MTWPFFKYVGCGNDFMIIDNRQRQFPFQDFSWIRKLCHRQFGIGADGLILLENSSCADFRMRIFNADGFEAEMCGNGLRCLAKFIQELKFPASSYRIETMHRLVDISYEGTDISVKMDGPTELKWNIELLIPPHLYSIHYLNTGVPHVVLFADDIEKLNLKEIGPFIRHHLMFIPQGTNVNLAQRFSDQEVFVRTFERGVEGETLGCGTGAIAVALASAYCYQLNSPLYIRTASQEKLRIDFTRKNDTFSDITMTGSAYCTYRGSFNS
jgi:diaminopimelate epimerase